MGQVKHPLAAGPLLESDPLTDVAVAIEVMNGREVSNS